MKFKVSLTKLYISETEMKTGMQMRKPTKTKHLKDLHLLLSVQ